MDDELIYNQRSHIPCNAFNFKQNVLGESRDLDGRTRGLVLAKEFGIDTVDGAKVVHVLQEHLSPQFQWSPNRGRATMFGGQCQGIAMTILTVVLTTRPTSVPLASRTALRLASACSVCGTMPPSVICAVEGMSGMQPETKTRSPALIACE